MPHEYLHNHPKFADLMRIVAQEKGIDPALVEKDYWIMHCLYGLQLVLTFELKGGTSLSKGFQIIDRFSEGYRHPYRTSGGPGCQNRAIISRMRTERAARISTTGSSAQSK
jgi:hypothetical protein